METEIGRWRCRTEDETYVTVVAYQHFSDSAPDAPRRRYPGARRFALTTGEAVRLIDSATFEVIADGELVRRTD